VESASYKSEVKTPYELLKVTGDPGKARGYETGRGGKEISPKRSDLYKRNKKKGCSGGKKEEGKNQPGFEEP